MCSFKVDSNDDIPLTFQKNNRLPISYKNKTLMEFQRYVIDELTPAHFRTEGGPEQTNIVTYFKILMLIGEFEMGLRELSKLDIYMT
mmetsp:Transcript_25802/g.25077  ORF Transcript_25802/g.25077 Transcript_25802/m.25077 type:complete len:87 (+) Transcript_25802:416-676(+)